MNLGCIYHQNRKYQKALEYYKMIEKYFAETYLLSSGSLYKTLLYNIAQINGMLGNYNEAMEKSKICIFIEMISFQVNGLCREIYNLGWCYGKMMLEEQNSQKKEQYKEYCKYFFQQSNVIAKFYQDEQAVEKIEYELKEEYKIKFSRNAIEV